MRRIALAAYRAEREIGVMQFSNRPGLRAQRNFGELQVTHLNLAVHPRPGTFVYEVNLARLPPDGKRLAGISVPSSAIQVDPGNPAFDERLAGIEAELQAGLSCYIASADKNGAMPMIYTKKPDPECAEKQPKTRKWPPNRIKQTTVTVADMSNFSTELVAERCKPYVIAHKDARKLLDPAPFGFKLNWIDFFAETFDGDHQVSQLVTILIRAIALGYAESGLGAPQRAMVELALMPSAVLLLMAEQDRVVSILDELDKELVIDRRRRRLIPLAEDDRNRLRNIHSLKELLELARKLKYQGPLPIAGYAAAPTPEPRRWVGWSLWSLVPGKRLGYTVKRLGLECYGVKRQSAVMQFSMGRGLDVITKFGRPRITAVDVRAHPSPSAFIYDLDLAKLPASGASYPTGRSWWRARWELSPDTDELAMQLAQMRYRIDRGTRYYLLPRPTAKTASPKIPIHQATWPHHWLAARRRLVFNEARSAYLTWRRARYTRVTRRRVRKY